LFVIASEAKQSLFCNVHDYFETSFDMGGQTITMGGRDMFVMVEDNGKWRAVADQFSPYPM